MESVDGKTPEDTLISFCQHLVALREMPELRGAEIVVIPESNLGNEGAHLELHLRNIISPMNSAGSGRPTDVHLDDQGLVNLAANLRRDVTFLRGVDRPGRVGVLTTSKTKKAMAEGMAVRLSDGLVAFHHNMICVSSGQHFGPLQAKAEMIRQLKAYERTLDYDIHGEVRGVRYSGKASGTDDLAISLQVVAQYARYYVEAPRSRGSVAL